MRHGFTAPGTAVAARVSTPFIKLFRRRGIHTREQTAAAGLATPRRRFLLLLSFFPTNATVLVPAGPPVNVLALRRTIRDVATPTAHQHPRRTRVAVGAGFSGRHG